MRRSVFIAARLPDRRSADLQPARFHLEMTVADLPRLLPERAWRRPAGDVTVRVVDTAVAGAEKDAGIRQPVDRAAEVRAVDGEDGEALHPVAADPDGGQRRLARPREGRWVLDVGLDGVADLKIGDGSHVPPLALRGMDERAEEIGEDRHADDGGGRRPGADECEVEQRPPADVIRHSAAP